jgi:L-ascorbate metabolism protein UlaG (beta-lactamase superfamily)
VKTSLTTLQSQTPLIIWFGHSSYLIHCKGFNILVDPVFCGHAAPFSFMVKAFKGADAYTAADMPPIDALILTHNHYDHFDTQTLQRLQPKIKEYYAPLGAGSLLEKYRIAARPVDQLDWWETRKLAAGIQLTATPARHFSGRGLKRNGSLWASFVLELFGFKVFLGGDSGYDTHFKDIGDKYGPFDIALLECGQYNTSWPFIHMMPEETVRAAMDLQAKTLMPVHWGKFALANHPWNEPIQRLAKKADELQLAITTPRIGEPVIVPEHYPHTPWWT